MKKIIFWAVWISFQIQAQSNAPLNVTVKNSKGTPIQGDQIQFVGQKSKKTIQGITNQQGTFYIEIPVGDIYQIQIKSIGPEIEYNTLEIPALASGQYYETNTLEIVYDAPTSFTLDRIQFETASAKLKGNSTLELEKLVGIMQLKPSLKILIEGHTDSDGNENDNLLLSSKRAEAVKNYLVQKGIAANRIETKGYGSSRPIAYNDTAEGKAKNRRTEIKVR